MNFTEGNDERDVTTPEKLRATNQEIPELKGMSCVLVLTTQVLVTLLV